MPSFSLLRLPSQPCEAFSNVDPSRLVEEKSLDKLEQLGGIEGIAISLKSNIKNGISGDFKDVSLRKKMFGTNSYYVPPSKSFFHFVGKAFKDPTFFILIVYAASSIAYVVQEPKDKEGWYDIGSIVVVMLLVTFGSGVINFRQSRHFDKLSNISSKIEVYVVRDGLKQQISMSEIVVGDVVCLKAGDQVPANGLFLEGYCLEVDESSMACVNDQVEVIHNQNPFLFSGTKVIAGKGKMLVTSVGKIGTWREEMSTVTRSSSEVTPLQAKLNKLASSMGKVGLVIGFSVLLVLLIAYFIRNTKDKDPNRGLNTGDVIDAVVGVIVDAVTIVDVAIPEGLPLAVTLILAYSMKRMMVDRKILVRELSSCETMGSATIICTAKTGTITLNQMEVTKFFLGLELIEEKNYTSIAANVLELFHQGVSLNTRGSVSKSEYAESGFKFLGSPTEKAILQWAVLKLQMDMELVKRNCVVLRLQAFNSEKKISGILMNRIVDNTIHAHVKGAAEIILAMCTHYLDSDGNAKALNEYERVKCDQIIQGMAASSLRCIAFAHKKLEAEDDNDGRHQKIPDSCLTLVGLLGLKDPCRPGVKNAMEDYQRAGVNIKMITGDNVFTAKAIATECGILPLNQETDEEAVVEGEEFRNYTEEERLRKVDKIRILARSSQFDKLLIVQSLRKKGHIVAMIGDGVNDALALKEADIGLSIGSESTQLAIKSSNIVILDGNFSSINTILKWGRSVYTNIQRFIQFQLAMNVALLVIYFIAAASSNEVPLTYFQFYWVSVVMNTLWGLAFALEKPTKDLLDKPPFAQSEPLTSNIMCRNLLPQAIYQILVLLMLQFKGESVFGITEEEKDAMFFNLFVLFQVVNAFNTRKLERKNIFEGICRNKLFLAIISVSLILHVAIVEFLKRFVDTERLDWEQWGLCIGFAIVSLPIGWLVKFIPVPGKPIFSAQS